MLLGAGVTGNLAARMLLRAAGPPGCRTAGPSAC